MIDDLDQRGLMIFSENVKLNYKGFDNKLKFSYIASKRILVIQLKDQDYTDLFDDLILSIYSKISKLTSLKDAAIL